MTRFSAGLSLSLTLIAILFCWVRSENSPASAVVLPAALSTHGATSANSKKEVALSDPYVVASGNSSSSVLPMSVLKQRVTDLAACARLENQRRIGASLVAQSTEGLNDYTRGRLDQNLATSSAQIAKLESEGACGGLDAAEMKGAIYPLLLEMARGGDADAAACYVAADFDLIDAQLKRDAIEDYRRNAEGLVREAMRNGDWRIVELMEAANDRDGDPHRGRYSWFREISRGDPALAYGYNRLIRLGATEDYASQLDRALDARKAELSLGQIADQDAWAEQEFKAHFARSTPINEYIPTCTLYSDRREFHNVLRSRG